jgi:hypothetical protein
MSRTMTPKWFLSLSVGKVSATEFIAKHRGFLSSIPGTEDILKRLDSGEVFPSIAMQVLQKAVLDHMLTCMVEKHAPKPQTSTALYNVQIRSATGIEDEKGFTSHMDAQRWADRRLASGAPNWHAVVTPNRVHAEKTQIIQRDDALFRLYGKKGTTPIMKTMRPSNGKLAWGVKAKPSAAKFSRG